VEENGDDANGTAGSVLRQVTSLELAQPVPPRIVAHRLTCRLTLPPFRPSSSIAGENCNSYLVGAG